MEFNNWINEQITLGHLQLNKSSSAKYKYSTMIGFGNKWRQKKRNAKKVNIPFDLTQDEYLQLAFNADITEPKQIGRGSNAYQLGRIGDTGGYVMGNCRFITQKQNKAEMGDRHILKRKGKDHPTYGRKGKDSHMYGTLPWEHGMTKKKPLNLLAWKHLPEIYQLWKDNNEPGYGKFRKIAVQHNYPDVYYENMIKYFDGSHDHKGGIDYLLEEHAKWKAS
ncbi:hypothetical protein [Endozoicomonas sp. SCSIO W0465]|uniref:hypothetical protein n=1 Tax=Endozoicomonas sp. SCSIO W0465 TaxID=2918516 RepID=UPI002074F5D8|nr:hypothetical protein [Endozoicomonas sp. SCSIO W0465]USE39539.1 hypothetical protein MJO57_16055 [Endozoicomonas sp. SCSIO W0465]